MVKTIRSRKTHSKNGMLIVGVLVIKTS